MANFKTVELKGYTKADALNESPFQVIKDATQAWKNAGKPVTEKALKEFCAEYLQKTTKMAAGVGCSITFDAGVADTRERPYTITDVKNEKGKRSWKKGIQATDKETGKVLFTCFGSKTDAKNETREMYMEGYKGDLEARYVKEVSEGEVLAFTAKYTPSKSAKMGTYIAFGVEA